MQKNEIVYPCQWSFTLIGSSESEITDAAACHVTKSYTLQSANTSRTGKYRSMILSTHVDSESERNRIFMLFQQDIRIKMVL